MTAKTSKTENQFFLRFLLTVAIAALATSSGYVLVSRLSEEMVYVIVGVVGVIAILLILAIIFVAKDLIQAFLLNKMLREDDIRDAEMLNKMLTMSRGGNQLPRIQIQPGKTNLPWQVQPQIPYPQSQSPSYEDTTQSQQKEVIVE
jgi:hypothetical protein